MKILYNILFQILYTLEVYNRIGVKHNDLHTNNIFVLVREKTILIQQMFFLMLQKHLKNFTEPTI